MSEYDIALVANALTICPVNVLDNERLTVDFTPLYQCVHIYGALDALDEIRKSYQADRKVSAYRDSAGRQC